MEDCMIEEPECGPNPYDELSECPGGCGANEPKDCQCDAGLIGDAIAARPMTAVVERWSGSGWIERRLVWNGESYVRRA